MRDGIRAARDLEAHRSIMADAAALAEILEIEGLKEPPVNARDLLVRRMMEREELAGFMGRVLLAVEGALSADVEEDDEDEGGSGLEPGDPEADGQDEEDD